MKLPPSTFFSRTIDASLLRISPPPVAPLPPFLSSFLAHALRPPSSLSWALQKARTERNRLVLFSFALTNFPVVPSRQDDGARLLRRRPGPAGLLRRRGRRPRPAAPLAALPLPLCPAAPVQEGRGRRPLAPGVRRGAEGERRKVGARAAGGRGGERPDLPAGVRRRGGRRGRLRAGAHRHGHREGCRRRARLRQGPAAAAEVGVWKLADGDGDDSCELSSFLSPTSFFPSPLFSFSFLFLSLPFSLHLSFSLSHAHTLFHSRVPLFF